MVDTRDLVTIASDAAFAVDEDSRIVGWNKAAHDLLGYADREVIGRPCCEILQAVIRGLGGRRPGLFVTGNYFAGPSVTACLSLAQETAVGVHDYLGRGERPANRYFDAVSS